MKYDNLRAFEKYLEGVNPQKFSPLYFILGIDHFECLEAINLLLRTLLPEPGQKELSLTHFPISSGEYRKQRQKRLVRIILSLQIIRIIDKLRIEHRVILRRKKQ